MEDKDSGDLKQSNFHDVKGDIQTLVGKVIEDHLKQRTYSSKDSQKWSNTISEKIIADMRVFNSNFKYIVTCIILQKGESGLSLSSTCYWNSVLDGNITVRWDNSTMYCIVNVFGVAL